MRRTKIDLFVISKELLLMNNSNNLPNRSLDKEIEGDIANLLLNLSNAEYEYLLNKVCSINNPLPRTGFKVLQVTQKLKSVGLMKFEINNDDLNAKEVELKLFEINDEEIQKNIEKLLEEIE